MQPIKHTSQYELLTTNHAALIEAVNDELYGTKQDKKDIAAQIATLKAHFSQMIEEYGYEVVVDANHETPQEDPVDESIEEAEKELQQIKQQTIIAQQKKSELTSETKPGVWYKIYNGEGRALRRLKLSVILTEAAQLIFVDLKGVKVIEKDEGDLPL